MFIHLQHLRWRDKILDYIFSNGHEFSYTTIRQRAKQKLAVGCEDSCTWFRAGLFTLWLIREKNPEPDWQREFTYALLFSGFSHRKETTNPLNRKEKRCDQIVEVIGSFDSNFVVFIWPKKVCLPVRLPPALYLVSIHSAASELCREPSACYLLFLHAHLHLQRIQKYSLLFTVSTFCYVTADVSHSAT